MSNVAKKRPRKSKLTPRRCSIDSEEEDSLLQIQRYDKKVLPVNQADHHDKNCTDTCVKPRTSKIPKISIEPVQNPQESTPNVTFQIKVEVEACDGNEDIEIKEFIMNQAMEEVLNIQLPEAEEFNGKLTGKILKDSENIVKTSSNVADKILDVGLRNVLGNELIAPFEQDPIEKGIQEILYAWKIAKETKRPYILRPLFYKCYLCSYSWWNLEPFQTHMLSKHRYTKNLNFDLENYTPYEVNLIAHTGKHLPKIRDIDVLDGFCSLCGKTYHFHKLSSRQSRMYYRIVNGCQKNYTTCLEWSKHTKFCMECRKNANISCEVCYTSFTSKFLLKQHFIACHSVRSDELAEVPYKVCHKCDLRYICDSHHVCKSVGKWDCVYCFRSFISQKTCQDHMDTQVYLYDCQICGENMKWDCQKYEHLLKHSGNYMLAKKCRVCKEMELFLKDEDIERHKQEVHGNTNVEFSKIIIPKSCIPYITQSLPQIQHIESIVKTEPDDEPPPEYDEDVPGSTEQLEEQNVQVKEEPQEIFEQETLVIKEEIEDYEEQTENIETEPQYTEECPTNFDPEIDIKEEFEFEEMEGDIIKLNFDITDHLETIVNEEDSQSSDFSPKKIRKKHVKINFSCKKCGYKGTKDQLKIHNRSICEENPNLFHNKKIHCSKCDTTFDRMKLYLKHLVDHGYAILTCPECLRQFEQYYMLTYHLYSHMKRSFIRVKYISMANRNSEKRCLVYQCQKCSANVDLEDFLQHWEMHLPNHPSEVGDQENKDYKLKIASEISTSRPCEIFQEEKIQESLRLIQQHNKKIECNHCNRRFTRLSVTKRHIIEHLLAHAYSLRPILKELCCQICGAGFTKKEKYKQHLRDHASMPVYKCESCDKTFSDSSNFTKHKKVHNWRCLVCDVCGAKFQIKSTLEKHLELHMKSNPVKCEPCNKIFHFESTYRKHIRKFHEKKPTRFKCQFCTKDFASLKLKWNHLWEVHQERKAKADCPLCFKSYRRYIDVKQHLKSDHNVDMSKFKLRAKMRKNNDRELVLI